MNEPWVLFDLDGTLTRSEEGIWNCARHALEKMGFPEPDPDTLRKFIGPPLTWSFREYAGMTEEQAQQALLFYRERYNTEGLFENRVYPGVRRMLRLLRDAGFRLGVVTGKPALPTGRILAHFALDRYMETVVCATDGHEDKAGLIAQALPEGHGETWMVGDRRFDMEGAVRAGVQGLGALWGYGSAEELEQAGAERLAATPREAAELLCPGQAGPRGAFLCMEGLDGSGKGTQIERLADTLDRFGFEVRRSREPGGTPIGEKIRAVLLDPENAEMAPETEALLYAASRAQHVREVIRPALRDGAVLLCDRFIDSSAAYQGGGRRLGVETVLEINRTALDGTLPDRTVLLDMDPKESLRRRLAVSEPDRLEREAEGFYLRTGQAYRELAEREPGRFIVVDASRSREDVAREIAEKVLSGLLAAEG